MNDLQLPWLIPTLMKVIGMALVLGVLGFAYEESVLEKKSILAALERGVRVKWVATAVVMFALGEVLTGAGWMSKGIASTLALVLMCLAWIPQRRTIGYRDKVVRQRITAKTLIKLAAQIYIGLFLVIISIWVISIGWHAYHLYGLVKEVQVNQGQLQVKMAVPMIIEAASDVDSIHAVVKPLFPIFNALEGLPGIGSYLGQVEPLLTYASGVSTAGREIITGLEPMLGGNTTNGTGEPSLPERANLALQLGHEHFVAAVQAIELASGVRDRIQPERLPGPVKELFARLDERFNLLEAGGQFLQVAPGLLGNGGAQKYLVLAQNRDELRATGGFISGIGLVTIQDGKIVEFTLGDSYAVDDFSKPYPSPPEALKRFMLADYWVARDANWSPDFPTTAKEAQSLYTLSTGLETQGVLAFNQLAVERVLALIGPLQVPGTDEPVTAENVVNYMRQAWAPEPEQGLSQTWWEHRKDFMSLLGNAILEKVLKTSDETQLFNLAKSLIDLLEQGQLLVYFDNSSAQAALERGGWDGALHPGDGDYLYLVDSNVGFNKMDSVIKRSLSYQVDLRDINHPQATVKITYQNTGTGDVPCKQIISYGNGTYQDMQQRCYLDYWRLYTPKGAGFVASNAQAVPADLLLNGEGWSGQVEDLTGEAGTQVFAGLVLLPLSKSTQIDVSYSLPREVIQRDGTNLHSYALTLQLQPGLEGLPVQIEINLPDNQLIINTEDGWKLSKDNTWMWQGIVKRSETFELTLSRVN